MHIFHKVGGQVPDELGSAQGITPQTGPRANLVLYQIDIKAFLPGTGNKSQNETTSIYIEIKNAWRFNSDHFALPKNRYIFPCNCNTNSFPG